MSQSNIESQFEALLSRIERDPDFDEDLFFKEHSAHAVELRRRLERLRRVGMLPARSDRPMAAHARDSRYQVGEEIGRGGMGAVYRVRDLDLDRDVAMKVARSPGETGDTSLGYSARLERFLNEARVLSRLEHPNIVPVHELGFDEQGRAYFTMKLVQGRTLLNLIQSGELSQDQSLQIIQRVCDALAYAHSRGIVHRDLKPSNVMVGEFGEVLLMDWGLAKWLDRLELNPTAAPASTSYPESPQLTREGEIFGTPSYLSPEQARGETDKIDARTDVFGVGALLFHMLTGRPLFVGDDLDEILEKAKEGSPDLGEAALPRELRAICQKACQRGRSSRYQSAGGLSDDLSAYREARQGVAWRETPVSGLLKRVRRNPARSVAVAAAGMIVLAGIQVAPWLTDLGRREGFEAATTATERERRLLEIHNVIDPIFDPNKPQLDRAIHKVQLGLAAFSEWGFLPPNHANRPVVPPDAGMIAAIRGPAAEALRDLAFEMLRTADVTLDSISKPSSAVVAIDEVGFLRNARKWTDQFLEGAVEDREFRRVMLTAWRKYWGEGEVVTVDWSGQTSGFDLEVLGQLFLACGEDESAEDVLQQAVVEATDRAWARILLCEAFRRNGKSNRIMSQQEFAVRVRPNWGTLRKYLGLSYDQVGDRQTAVEQFSVAHRIDPSDAEALGLLANECRKLAKRHRRNNRIFQDFIQRQVCRTLLAEAESKGLDHYSIDMTRAWLAFDEGRSAEGMSILEREAALPDAHWSFSSILGYQREISGDLLGAEFAYREAIARDPNGSIPLVNLAGVLTRLGRPSESEALLREALARVPDNTVASFELGALLSDQGRAEEAVRYLQHSASGTSAEGTNLQECPARARLALIWAESGNYAEYDRECALSYSILLRRRAEIRPDEELELTYLELAVQDLRQASQIVLARADSSARDLASYLLASL